MVSKVFNATALGHFGAICLWTHWGNNSPLGASKMDSWRYRQNLLSCRQRVWTHLSDTEALGCKSGRKLSGAELSQLLGSIQDSTGAGRGSRTPKTRRSADFESAASASSAIPALLATTGFLRPALAVPFFQK